MLAISNDQPLGSSIPFLATRVDVGFLCIFNNLTYNDPCDLFHKAEYFLDKSEILPPLCNYLTNV